MKPCHLDFYDVVEEALLKVPVATRDCGELTHHFSDGIYLRTVRMKPGTLAIGHRHKTRHFNLLLKGTVTITSSDGMAATLTAPVGFESGPGVRKIAFAHTEVELCSVHPNPDNCVDVAILENRFVTKTKASVAFEKRKAIA